MGTSLLIAELEHAVAILKDVKHKEKDPHKGLWSPQLYFKKQKCWLTSIPKQTHQLAIQSVAELPGGGSSTAGSKSLRSSDLPRGKQNEALNFSTRKYGMVFPLFQGFAILTIITGKMMETTSVLQSFSPYFSPCPSEKTIQSEAYAERWTKDTVPGQGVHHRASGWSGKQPSHMCPPHTSVRSGLHKGLAPPTSLAEANLQRDYLPEACFDV